MKNKQQKEEVKECETCEGEGLIMDGNFSPYYDITPDVSPCPDCRPKKLSKKQLNLSLEEIVEETMKKIERELGSVNGVEISDIITQSLQSAYQQGMADGESRVMKIAKMASEEISRKFQK